MRQSTNASFNDGLVMDMNPLGSPNTALSDCLNGTIITYNGNEFTLQNDMGNTKLNESKLPQGSIPLGMKEYGGILYLALYNPITNMCEVGSIPSPDYATSPRDTGNDVIEFEASGIGSDTEGFKFKDKLLKLFDFEEMTLHPGDEYVLGYKVNSGIDPFVNNSIYNVELFAIDESNKQYKLNKINTQKLNEEEDPIEYGYFNNTVNSILAMSVKLNNLTWFETFVYEKDDNIVFNLNGGNRINLNNSNVDDLFIKGCQIKYSINEQVEQSVFFIEHSDMQECSTDEIFKHTFIKSKDDLNVKDGDSITFEITPYDQYNMIDFLKKTNTVVIGKKMNFTEFGNTFKHKYDAYLKQLRLDFEINVLGMSNPYVYLECYDIWSGYSTIIPVEGFNPSGVTTVFIDTVDEKPINQYDDFTQGGTTKQLIQEYVVQETIYGKIYKPFICNNVRVNSLLRENNLYIVRIATIDQDSISDMDDIKIEDYFNTYKLLIVSDGYNNYYDQVKDLPENFNNINFNNNVDVELDYSVDLLNKVNNDSYDDDIEIKTIIDDDVYYYDLNGDITNDNEYNTYVSNYEQKTNYKINSSIKSYYSQFGNIEIDNLKNYKISKHSFDIDKSNSQESLTSEIELDGDQIAVTLRDFKTIKARVTKNQKQGTVVDRQETVADGIYKHNNSLEEYGFYMKDGDEKWNNRDYPTKLIKRDGNEQMVFSDNALKSNDVVTVLNKLQKNGLIMSFKGTVYGQTGYTVPMNLYTSNDKKSYNIINRNSTWVLFLRDNSNDHEGWTAVGFKHYDKRKVIDIINDLYIDVIKNRLNNLTYYTDVMFDLESDINLECSLEIESNIGVQLYQNFYNEGNNFVKCDNNQQLLDLINGKMMDLPGWNNLESINYFDLTTSTVQDSYSTKLSEIELNTNINTDVKDKLVNSLTHLNEFNPSLENPPEQTLEIKSKSGNYKKYFEDFVVDYDRDLDKVTFLYNYSDGNRKTGWADTEINKDRMYGYKMNNAYFDE